MKHLEHGDSFAVDMLAGDAAKTVELFAAEA